MNQKKPKLNLTILKLIDPSVGYMLDNKILFSPGISAESISTSVLERWEDGFQQVIQQYGLPDP